MLNIFSSEQDGTCYSLLPSKWGYTKNKTIAYCLDFQHQCYCPLSNI